MVSAPKIDSRPTVLVLLGAARPGETASGALRSVEAMASALAGEFHFLVLGRDRAAGKRPRRDPAPALTCRTGALGALQLAGLMQAIPHDLLMLNGFFARDFTVPALLLRRVRMVGRRPTILSPHGELAPAALALKPGRKRVWLVFARRTRLLADVHLHAAGPEELSDIRTAFPWAAGYLTAGAVTFQPDAAPNPVREPDPRLRILFLGRITPVKNLHFALQALALLRAPVTFDILGPVEDRAYWKRCRTLIAALPPNVTVSAPGEVGRTQAVHALGRADLLFLPSVSENFGHAIHEALAAGVPVLIGDRTPWRDLQRGKAGWDLPLDDPAPFAAAIDALAAMPAGEREALHRGARAAATAYAVRDPLEETRRMLWSVLAADRRRSAPARTAA